MSIETRKKQSRIRRVNRSRGKIQQKIRLCVHRTPRHIYAQIIDTTGANVLAAASSLESTIREQGYTGNAKSAALVGKAIAERALKKGIKSLAFDRSGYLYHGRVKCLADAAREAGLQF